MNVNEYQLVVTPHYINHNPTKVHIPIINPDEHPYHDHLWICNVNPISGYYGVYADNEQEAFDMLADYAAETIPDPQVPNFIHMRWPGLIASWSEVMDEYDEDEQAVADFCSGPFGNEGWYFTCGGNGIHIWEVQI